MTKRDHLTNEIARRHSGTATNQSVCEAMSELYRDNYYRRIMDEHGYDEEMTGLQIARIVRDVNRRQP
jgi:hypothetical protein